jgi:hypothetical protein
VDHFKLFGAEGAAVHEFHWHASWSWCRVGDFADFLALSQRARRCESAALDLGDIVQLKDYGIKHHTMIVTGVQNGVPFVTYHTNDTRQKSLNDVSAEEKICWKIFDMYDDSTPALGPGGEIGKSQQLKACSGNLRFGGTRERPTTQIEPFSS